MIRVYVDWNIVSNLKKPEFQEIRAFIDKHKKQLLFVYSPAHFNDLMKSYSPSNELFKLDLATLEYLCDKHLIRWEDNCVKPLFATPTEYFETAKNKENIFELFNIENVFETVDNTFKELGLDVIGTSMKTFFQSMPSGIEIPEGSPNVLNKLFPKLQLNSTMWDLMQDIMPMAQKLLHDGSFYKDFRKSIGDSGLKLESNSGNWNESEVIKNIDEYLNRLGTKMTYLEFVKSSFKHRKEPMNLHEYYTTAYLMLDMIGYKMDKLPKPTDSMQNIQTDGEHSFYAGHCDYFVAMDKKLRIKSKILYKEFKVSTTVIELKQLISELEKVINPISESGHFLEAVSRFNNKDNLIKAEIPENEQSYTFIFKLPKPYFGFFNRMVYTNYVAQQGIIIVFDKISDNLSNFFYYTEDERLITDVTDYFGYDDQQELATIKEKFVYRKLGGEIVWKFESGIIKLSRDDVRGIPELAYAISTKPDEQVFEK